MNMRIKESLKILKQVRKISGWLPTKKLKIVYLAGSMWKTKGHGKGWRDRFIKAVTPHKIRCFSPPDREGEIAKNFKLPSDVIKKVNRLPMKLRILIFKDIIWFDIEEVLKSDALIVYYTKESGGTCTEMSIAFLFGIPVYVVDASHKLLNPWPECCMTKIFYSWKKLHSFLERKYGLKTR